MKQKLKLGIQYYIHKIFTKKLVQNNDILWRMGMIYMQKNKNTQKDKIKIKIRGLLC